MSGVWVFNKNGVMRLVENPYNQSSGESSESSSSGGSQQQRMRRKILVHLPTTEVVSSYGSLENILRGLGWERYYGGDNTDHLIQFHKRTSIDLISLPRDFSKFNSIHMYDIVVKNPNVFHVRDMQQSIIKNWPNLILQSSLLLYLPCIYIYIYAGLCFFFFPLISYAFNVFCVGRFGVGSSQSHLITCIIF